MTNDNKNRFGVLLALLLTVALAACDANPRKEAESRGEAGSAPCLQKTPQGLCIIELGVSGAAPVRFETEADNLQRLPDGSLHVANRLVLVMPDVRWTLTEASVTFKPAADGKGFDRIVGEARIPFDKLPILDKAKTGGGVMAALGYDLGSNLDQLNAPLNPQTRYLFFAFKESFGVSFGFSDLGIPVRGGESASQPFKFTPLPEVKLVMVVDAADPFFYVSAKGLSPKKKKGKGKQEEEEKKKKPSLTIGGFGFSYHNRIPESVETPDFSKQMRGTLVLEGSVPFPPAPVISYSGFYLVGQDARLQAISGDISLGFPLKWLVSFSLSLGDASAIAEVEGDRVEILLAGRYQPDTSWVPAVIPLFPEQDVQMTVRLDSADRDNNFVHGRGSFALAGSAFAPQGLRFGKVYSQQGDFRISYGTITMKGGVDSDLAPFRFGAGTHFDAVVAAAKADNRLGIDGNILVGSFDSQGQLTITPSAVTLSAKINAGSDWQMGLLGELRHDAKRGPMLSGNFQVPAYLNDRIATEVTRRATATEQDLQRQIGDLTRQLDQLTLDLPGIRAAAKQAAEQTLWHMDTGHDGALVNREIDKQCGKVPLCPAAAKKVYNGNNRVQQTRQRLSALIATLRKNDDPSTRAALKSALRAIIDGNPVRIEIPAVGGFSLAYLDKARKARLQAAIDQIDKLKTTGGKRVDAKRQLDHFAKGTLSGLARQIEQGANPLKVKSLGFDMPAEHDGAVRLSLELAIVGREKPVTLGVDFDPKQPQRLPQEIVGQLVKL
ncbi:MAG: hypothetical protein P8178_10075 [Candidatus Thiodiazotropha sp.]